MREDKNGSVLSLIKLAAELAAEARNATTFLLDQIAFPNSADVSAEELEKLKEKKLVVAVDFLEKTRPFYMSIADGSGSQLQTGGEYERSVVEDIVNALEKDKMRHHLAGTLTFRMNKLGDSTGALKEALKEINKDREGRPFDRLLPELVDKHLVPFLDFPELCALRCLKKEFGIKVKRAENEEVEEGGGGVCLAEAREAAAKDARPLHPGVARGHQVRRHAAGLRGRQRSRAQGRVAALPGRHPRLLQQRGRQRRHRRRPGRALRRVCHVRGAPQAAARRPQGRRVARSRRGRRARRVRQPEQPKHGQDPHAFLRSLRGRAGAPAGPGAAGGRAEAAGVRGPRAQRRARARREGGGAPQPDDLPPPQQDDGTASGGGAAQGRAQGSHQARHRRVRRQGLACRPAARRLDPLLRPQRAAHRRGVPQVGDRRPRPE